MLLALRMLCLLLYTWDRGCSPDFESPPVAVFMDRIVAGMYSTAKWAVADARRDCVWYEFGYKGRVVICSCKVPYYFLNFQIQRLKDRAARLREKWAII